MATTTEHVETLAEVFLACRDLRHQWEVDGYFRAEGNICRTLACRRCHATRTDYWSPDGERLSSSYRYPKDYSIKGGVTYKAVRQEVIRRVEVYANEADMMASVFAKGA